MERIQELLCANVEGPMTLKYVDRHGNKYVDEDTCINLDRLNISNIDRFVFDNVILYFISDSNGHVDEIDHLGEYDEEEDFFVIRIQSEIINGVKYWKLPEYY